MSIGLPRGNATNATTTKPARAMKRKLQIQEIVLLCCCSLGTNKKEENIKLVE
jgi:hypothetical protein